MDYQDLCEIADREIRLGTYNRTLMTQARDEAGGVAAHAHQIYWRLRAAQLRADAARFSAGDHGLYLKEVRARLDAEEGGRRLRASIVGWAWVIVCFASFTGAAVCFFAAKASFHRSSQIFLSYAVCGIVCVALAVVAYVVSKKDAGQDPFAVE